MYDIIILWNYFLLQCHRPKFLRIRPKMKIECYILWHRVCLQFVKIGTLLFHQVDVTTCVWSDQWEDWSSLGCIQEVWWVHTCLRSLFDKQPCTSCLVRWFLTGSVIDSQKNVSICTVQSESLSTSKVQAHYISFNIITVQAISLGLHGTGQTNCELEVGADQNSPHSLACGRVWSLSISVIVVRMGKEVYWSSSQLNYPDF